MEYSIITSFSENKAFHQKLTHTNKLITKKEHYRLNSFLLNKCKKHHHMELLIQNLLKIATKIRLYLNLYDHKNQTYHLKIT